MIFLIAYCNIGNKKEYLRTIFQLKTIILIIIWITIYRYIC